MAVAEKMVRSSATVADRNLTKPASILAGSGVADNLGYYGEKGICRKAFSCNRGAFP